MTTSSSSSEWSSTCYRITAAQNLSYSIRRRQRWFPAGEHGSRCTLVSLTIAGDDGSPLRIPCCDRGGMHHEYLDRHAIAVARELCRRFPDIPPRYDEHIARTLMGEVVFDAAMSHRCPLPPGRPCPGLGVVLEINAQDLAGRAIRVEEARPRPRPATADSVRKLLAAKRTDECEEDHDCVICTEEIKTRRSSLAMACSHVFHKHCLLRWLQISHVCPLCRYEMPCCNVQDLS